ncbi:MAG: asparagine synthase (glutamine-hydrolyzing) [Candidatus Omnitrophota bacterium]
MCGICGYVYADRTKRPSEAVLKGMMDTLAHRGPDDSGSFIRGPAALGHRRLSIIDLKTGRQPMSNEDGSITIVYNGEIYNFPELREALSEKGHVFKTRSDTEVIIRAYEEYGESCLGHFNGMFAFALWDAGKERLFLARDRFGKKPLYYAFFDNQLIFASELKSLLKHPSARRQIDMSSVSKYLAYEYIPSPRTIFRDIKKLEPASKLLFEKGRSRVERYWDMKTGDTVSMDPEETGKRIIGLLKDSVRRRLISDVPLGVFLSGGIDSSAVVAMMAELVSPKEIKTFSVGFREKLYDESGDARTVAGHFGTDHHEEILKPGTMLEVFPAVLDMLDEPFADSSIIPTYIVSRFTRRHVTVALGGDGGDELFMGYPSFFAHKLNGYFNLLPEPVRSGSVKLLTGMLPVSHDYNSRSYRAARFLRGLDLPEEVRHQVWTGSFTPAEQEKLFLPNAELSFDPLDLYDTTAGLYRNAKGADPLDRAAYIYAKTYMADDILAKVDRASMAVSLEVRAPFLDKDFAEFVMTIPGSMKMKGFRTKWILKKALEGKLPGETLAKPKRGFAVPVAAWLKNDLKGLLTDAFDKTKIEREGIFRYPYIKSMVDAFMADKNDTRKELWALFMFEMWYDRWMK